MRLLMAVFMVAAFAGSAVGQAEDGAQVKAQLESLLEEREYRELAEWFREHPDEALPFIDSYLEGGLKMIEEGGAAAAAQDSFAKGVKFARIASAAFDDKIFVDYASAFAGWSLEEQQKFRQGQQAFREGRAAHKAGEFAKALGLHEKSMAWARSLGDWWGMAMATGGIARAKLALDDAGEAAGFFERAAKINSRLRLRLGEAVNLAGLAQAQVKLGQVEEAAKTAAQAKEKLKESDPAPVRREVLTAVAEAYAAAGREEDAAKVRELIPEVEEEGEAEMGDQPEAEE